jgi:adenylate cyclase
MHKITIGEDIPFQVAMLKAALSKGDRDLSFYSDGLELYRSLLKETPDLALLDIIMPRLSGLAITRLLKFHQKTKSLKIILVSSITDADIGDLALQCGGDAFLPKPIDFNALDDKINALLKGAE